MTVVIAVIERFKGFQLFRCAQQSRNAQIHAIGDR